jgi:hypothetical protein
MKTKIWTEDDVAARFEEAVDTLARLPDDGCQNVRCLWPEIVRTQKEKLEECADVRRIIPPSPSAISRMYEVLEWMFILRDEAERKIIWMRAEDKDWKEICWRVGFGRTKATEIRNKALLKIATYLNYGSKPKRNGV